MVARSRKDNINQQLVVVSYKNKYSNKEMLFHQNLLIFLWAILYGSKTFSLTGCSRTDEDYALK